ncbi:MAG: hypothetical protein ACE5E9_14385 [Nitrospinaceae bacterium]
MTTKLVEETMETGVDTEGKELDLNNYFAVRGRMWSPKDQDHTIEISDEIGFRRFSELNGALEHFQNIRYEDFPGDGTADIRVELIHFRFGIPHTVKSRILFP